MSSRQPGGPAAGAFGAVIGQEPVVATLQAAVAAAQEVLDGGPGVGMTHAWLFTGPPGSGRSVVARGFAAALQCPDGGCGHCHACRTALGGQHADVEVVTPSGLSYSVAETRRLVERAALSPSGGRWQVTIVEDADRFTEQALNAVLTSLEEPPARCVWLLCAPSVEDLLPTIRSRCRVVTLRVPPYPAIADRLEAEGVDRPMAAFAARAAQGHVGRARRLARDPEAVRRRREVLEIPLQTGNIGGCFTAAANLVDAAKDEATAVSAELDAAETGALKRSYGDTGERGVPRPRGVAGALSELERRQKSRATRVQRDALDRALVDLASFYRDVLVLQLDAGVDLVNADLRTDLEAVARASSRETTLRRVEAVLAAREAIDANASPLLAVEAMTVALSTA